MRCWGLAIFCVLLLTSAADAETITDGTPDFSVEVDATGACVVVPDRTSTGGCVGMDIDALRKVSTLPASDVVVSRFAASMPLGQGRRYFIHISSVHTTTSAPRLTDAELAQSARELHDNVAREAMLEVSEPSTSAIATDDGIDRATIHLDAHAYDAGFRVGIADVEYDLYLYIGAHAFVMIQVSAPKPQSVETNAAVRALLSTMKLTPMPAAPQFARRAGEWVGRIVAGSAMTVAVVMIGVTLWRRRAANQPKRKRRKKRRSSAPGD